eukprot:496367_1
MQELALEHQETTPLRASISDHCEVKQSLQIDCHDTFSECQSAKRIKTILLKYNENITKARAKSANELHEAIHRISWTDSNRQLLNDFYHIKYDHKTGADPNQFNAFYEYLFDDDTLICDIEDCHATKTYYARRNRSYLSSQDRQDHHMIYSNGYNFVCRIHVYFIHSFHTSQSKLASNEIAIEQIERQLSQCKDEDENTIHDKKLELLPSVMNCKTKSSTSVNVLQDYAKFITKEGRSINWAQICAVLTTKKIIIKKDKLEKIFDDYGYDEEQLIRDICNVLVHEREDKTLLYDTMTNELNPCDEQYIRMIYGIICHEYIMTNPDHFTKILQSIASNLNPRLDPQEIADIARNAGLNASVFIKGATQFKNSIQFAKTFKTMTNWNKKEWSNIYVTMNKWKTLHIVPNVVTSSADNDLNYSEISIVLANNNVMIDQHELRNAFHEHLYSKSQLINDLCNILMRGNDEETLLGQILVKTLKYNDCESKQIIYDALLYDYIKKEDLNRENFIKLLQIVASEIIADVNCQQVATIATNDNLSSAVFNKKMPEFKNARSFASSFKTMDKWDKKSWCKIYHTINQWTPFKRNLSKSACTDIHAIPHPYELELEYEESKYKEIPVDDDPETELTDIILQFCALTTTTEHIATQYLEESQWSLCIAMNKFYLDNYDNNINDTSVDGAVYNHGIAFWYWSSEACT